MEDATKLSLYYLLLGVSGLLIAPIAKAPWLYVAERTNIAFRLHILESLLKQEPGWYDTQKAGELGSKTSLICIRIQKVGNTMSQIL